MKSTFIWICISCGIKDFKLRIGSAYTAGWKLVFETGHPMFIVCDLSFIIEWNKLNL